jgi:hypothetical protein
MDFPSPKRNVSHASHDFPFNLLFYYSSLPFSVLQLNVQTSRFMGGAVYYLRRTTMSDKQIHKGHGRLDHAQ